MKTTVSLTAAAISLLFASPASASAWFQNKLDQKGIPDVSVTIMRWGALDSANPTEKKDRIIGQVASDKFKNVTLVLEGIGADQKPVRLEIATSVHNFCKDRPPYYCTISGCLRKQPSTSIGVATQGASIPLVVSDYAPNSRTSRFKGVFRWCLKNSVIRSDAVITGSEASRSDMVAALRLKPKQADKVRVIYDGPGGQFDVQEHAPFETDKTRPRTLLYVGRMDPYKNVTGLVEALALAKKRLDFPLELIVCGPVDDRYPEARELATKLGVADDVRFTGFVSDEELGEFYRTSDLLTHSSRYEGFGLQLVEAMRSGLPVCCTDGGSQPEIVGDAGMVVKAGDALAMADAITGVLSSPAKMEAMKLAGLVRAERFDWAVCAQETATLYQRTVE